MECKYNDSDMSQVLEKLCWNYIQTARKHIVEQDFKKAQGVIYCIEQIANGQSSNVMLYIYIGRLYFCMNDPIKTRLYMTTAAKCLHAKLMMNPKHEQLIRFQELLYTEMVTIFVQPMFHQHYTCCKYCYLSSIFFFDLDQVEISLALTDRCEQKQDPFNVLV